jgi:hypothetical protein
MTYFLGFAIFVPKILMQLILSVLITIIFCMIVLAIVLVIYCLFVLLGPLSLCMLVSELQGNMRKLAILAIILLYPLISALFALILAIICVLYPFLRNTYHHGVFDPFDEGLSNATYLYLVITSKVWSL